MARILIVDDEPQIRQMMEETLLELEEQGVELILAGNGMDALEAIRQQQPDLVFLDTLMPKMNGWEVCHAVKKQLQEKRLRIVLLTTQGQESQPGRMEEAGVRDSLNKPLDPEEVYQTAVRALGLED